jgi:membrane-associated phospholipid phosphatase
LIHTRISLKSFSFQTLALLALAPAVLAQTPAAPATDPDRPLQVPGLVLHDTVAVFTAPEAWDGQDWMYCGLAVAAVAGSAVLLDRPVHNLMVRNARSSWDQPAQQIQKLGTSYAVALAGGFYLTGWATGKDEVRATGTDAISASLITGALIVPASKYVIGRAAPDSGAGPTSFKAFGGGDNSFPSGHTTEAFTLASVIASHYTDAWVQVASYGMASLVGVARLEQNAHWTSDVVAGGILGTVVGKAVVRMNQRIRENDHAGLEFSVVPEVRPGYRGLQASLRF